MTFGERRDKNNKNNDTNAPFHSTFSFHIFPETEIHWDKYQKYC